MSTDDEMDEVVAEFLVESNENLDALDRSLLLLERDPSNYDTLSSIFRNIHTIKGASGFLGFDRLGSLTHVAENLLSRLRDGDIRLTPAATAALFATVDAVRSILRCIEADGTDGVDDYEALKVELERLHAGDAEGPVDVAPGAADALGSGDVAGSADIAGSVDVAGSGDLALAAEVGEPVAPPPAAAPLASPPAPSGPAADAPGAVASPRGGEATVASPRGGAGAGEPSTEDEQKLEAAYNLVEQAGASSPSTIRVGVSLLDRLMNLVGELVLARNQILQCTTGDTDATFVATAQRLNLITTELQEGVMKTRMQPIGTIWARFPRVVRDLAVMCGKEIRLEMEGRDTELDRTLIEAITDPLTHLVRNAADHGIEAPSVRRAAGKAADGRLFLRAYHEGGHVNIEIADDGAGIDPERVRAKARARGLLRSEDLDRMSDREVANLIFQPGFSTAEKVTDISGRGVGLDVVKTNIERIGGTVDVTSELGTGTIFRVKIPLTLAIIPALVVTSAGDRYAIPQVNLVELVRLAEDGSSTGVEYVHGVPVHRLRGTLLPLVDLAAELGLRDRTDGSLAQEGIVSIVVVQAADQQFGLVVDGISDTEEIVVKPLGQQLKQVGTFAGATIMGDGRVALILDVMGLAQRAGVVSEVGDRGKDRLLATSTDLDRGEPETMLVVQVGEDRRMAIQLNEVNRLEEFEPADIEFAGSMEVVQYRNSILPLIRVADVVGVRAPYSEEPGGRLQVVVHDDGGRAVGLVVGGILDIVEEHLTYHLGRASAGTLGSVVIQGKVTDVIDVPGLVATVPLGAGPVLGVH